MVVLKKTAKLKRPLTAYAKARGNSYHSTTPKIFPAGTSYTYTKDVSPARTIHSATIKSDNRTWRAEIYENAR